MKSILNLFLVIITGTLVPVQQGMADARGGAVIHVADGLVEIADDGECSLIEALENAVDQAQTHADCEAGSAVATTVVLVEDADYVLEDVHNTNAGINGLPSLSGAVTIEGNGATIQRVGSAPLFRLMHVSAAGTVTLENLNLTGGSLAAGANDDGAGLYNEGTLTLHGVDMFGNSGAGDGGAIANAAGAELHVAYSAFENNGGGGAGGNIHNAGTAFINHSLLGMAGCAGGGCALFNSGTASVFNSTLASAGPAPANVINYGTLTLVHATLAGLSGGGPVSNFDNQGQATLRNSMVTGDFAGPPGSGSCGGFPLVFEGVNLIEDGSCECADEPACLVGDPQLGLLANHGGPTGTYPLLEGSIAIDAADDEFCPAYDQRGFPRPQFAGCDLGAFEVQAPPEPGIAFTPDSLDLGEVAVGNSSVVYHAIVENTGNRHLTGLAFTAVHADFSVDVTDCGTQLNIGQQCSVSVVFTPSALGLVDTTLSVSTAEEAGADLALSATGIELVDPLFSDRFEQ